MEVVAAIVVLGLLAAVVLAFKVRNSASHIVLAESDDTVAEVGGGRDRAPGRLPTSHVQTDASRDAG